MAEGGRPAAVLIAGPTASGKSALALALAARIGGIVINADSMQVYRELRILTARPGPDDEDTAPHRLYGHVPAAEAYSVGRWLDDLASVLAEARGSGAVPIVVGGTGLYVTAATTGLAAIPDIPPEIREELRAEAARLHPAALHARLAVEDPAMAARLRPSDPQRILRALEVLRATGRSLATWQADPLSPPLIGPDAVRLVLAPDRALLRARIDARFEAMMAEGALDEVRALAALGLDPALPAMRALGVAELRAALAGAMPLGEATTRATAETRRFAKRQQTWFRNRMADWPRLDPLGPGVSAWLGGFAPTRDR